MVPEIVEDEGEKEEDDDAAAGGSRVVRAEVGLDGRMALVAMASSRSVPPPLACVGRTWVRVLRAIVSRAVPLVSQLLSDPTRQKESWEEVGVRGGGRGSQESRRICMHVPSGRYLLSLQPYYQIAFVTHLLWRRGLAKNIVEEGSEASEKAEGLVGRACLPCCLRDQASEELPDLASVQEEERGEAHEGVERHEQEPQGSIGGPPATWLSFSRRALCCVDNCFACQAHTEGLRLRIEERSSP